MASAVTIGTTFGALEIGSLITTFFFGIITVQTHTYYSKYSKDRLAFRILVGAIWILDLTHTIIIAIEVYKATITNYGKPNITQKYPGIGVVAIVGGCITACVQGFFAYRVWTVLPYPWRIVGALCGAIAGCRLVVAWYHGIGGILADSMFDWVKNFDGVGLSLLISAAVVDVIVAVSMLWYFATRRDKAFPQVARLIDQLIAWTLRTGLMTSLASLSVVILFKTMPDNMIWLATYFSVAKFYSASVLSALNGRERLRDQMSSHASADRSSQPVSNRFPRKTSARAPNAPITVTMELESVEHPDEAKYGGQNPFSSPVVDERWSVQPTTSRTPRIRLDTSATPSRNNSLRA